MKAAFLVVFDIPAAAPEPTPEQIERVRGILADVVRRHTEDSTEVKVLTHKLTPAETAKLP
jgi:hypothetical protein